MKNSNKIIGILLIVGAISLFIPYTILTIIFEYPTILREETSSILTKFHEGGHFLIWTWWAFALTGIPLLPAFILIGKKDENALPKVATTIGIIGLIVQMIGLLRWTFVVPVLADIYVNSVDQSLKAAAIVSFKVIHQFGGVVLGEHLGQLFSIAWTVLLCIYFLKENIFGKWFAWFGLITSGIYMLEQTELFATVISTIYVIDWAGFVGSTLWLLWLVLLGIKYYTLQIIDPGEIKA